MMARNSPGFLALAAPLVSAFVALTLLPATAGADLTYPGAPAHEALFRRVYAGLPPRYREARVTVHEVPGADWEALDYYAGRSIVGLYLPRLRAAWVKGDQGDAELASTLAHELAHDLYDNVLTEDERGDWRRFFVDHPDWMPNAAARTTPSEGFAWVAEWLVCGKHLRPEARERVERLLGVTK